jgi:hypothetical protein
MPTVTLTFKTTDATARQLRNAAKAEQTTLSEYLRRAAEAKVRKPAKSAKRPDFTARSRLRLGDKADKPINVLNFIG